MVANTWYFGTTTKMLTLPLPSTGMGRKRVGYSEDLQYENGGVDIYRPYNATHFEYDISYSVREAAGAAGLDVFADIAAGLYGSPVVYFADPMYYDVNLFAPNFAAPALAEQGWKSIGGSSPYLAPVYSDTAANSFAQPTRSVTYTTDTISANAFPADGYATMIIPIPTGMTLWLGFSGSVTGTGVIRAESWLNGATTAASAQTLTALSPTGSTRLAQSIASTSANYAKIGVSATSSAAGSVTITSMLAQLWPTGTTPTLTGNFQSGQGANGCKFTTDALAEVYVLRDNQGRNVHYKGLAFGLKEIVR